MAKLPEPKIQPADGRVALRSPGVGLWRDAPRAGALLEPGASLGQLEVLGVLHPLTVPKGARGVVLADERPPLARRPVGHGDVLVTLDPEVQGAAAAAAEPEAGATASGGLTFTSPSSGRWYTRPAPDKPAFVQVGDAIRHGQTIGLLEVMKTFTRIQYGGDQVPESATIVRIVPADQDDLAAGDVILELET